MASPGTSPRTSLAPAPIGNPGALQLCEVSNNLEIRGKRWGGRFTLGTGRYRVALKVTVQGIRPATLRDQGDFQFELSRLEAQKKLDQVIETFQAELAEGRAPKLRLLKAKAPAPLVEPLLVVDLPTAWREIYDKDLPSIGDTRKRLVRRAKSKRYLDQIESMLGSVAAYITTVYPRLIFVDELEERHLDECLSHQWANYLGVAASYNKVLVGIRGAFHKLVKAKRIASNPLIGIALIEDDTPSTVARETFTPEEVEKLLEEASRSDPLVHQLMRIVMCTGLKKIDACNLAWKSIDLRARTISVTPAKRGAPVKIPIFDPLLKEIRAAAKIRSKKKALKTGKGHAKEVVFTDLADKFATDPCALNYRFYEVCRRCGMTDRKLFVRKRGRRVRAGSIRGIHSLRTTFITLALDAGIEKETIKLITGHRTDMIVSRYNRPRHERLKERFVTSALSVITGVRAPGIASAGKMAKSNQGAREMLVRGLRHLDPATGVSMADIKALQPDLLRYCASMLGPAKFRTQVEDAIYLMTLATLSSIRTRLLRLLGGK